VGGGREGAIGGGSRLSSVVVRAENDYQFFLVASFFLGVEIFQNCYRG
jgi:hypothetical protein